MNIRKQRGVALITVLLVLAVIAILASQLTLQSKAAIRKTAWVTEEAQAWQYALGAEELARVRLKKYIEESKSLNNQNPATPNTGNNGIVDDILAPLPPFPADHGEIQLQITDRQAQLNIASLPHSGHTQNAFKRLLEAAYLPEEIADSVIDWQDNNQSPTGTGQEDSGYLANDPPYRTANREIADISELRAIQGVDDKGYALIAPHLTPLPLSKKLNINTASAEVLSTLADELDGQQVVQQREQMPGGFKSIEEFMLSSATAGLTIDTSMLDTSSSEYAVKILSRFSERTLSLYSRLMVDTETGKVQLLDRTLGRQLTVETQKPEKDEQNEQQTDPLF